MKAPTVIGIAVAAAILAVLGYRLVASSEVEAGLSDPPQPIVIELPRLGEQRSVQAEELQRIVDSYNASFTARLDALMARFEEASKDEDTDAQDQVAAQWNELIAWQERLDRKVDNFAQWIHEQEEGLGDDEELPGNDVIPPPPPVFDEPPPTVTTTSESGGESGGMDLGPMLELARGVACVANPALCAPVSLVLSFLGAFKGDIKDVTKAVETIGKVAAGESVSEEELNHVFQTVEQIGEAAVESWETLIVEAGDKGANPVAASINAWASGAALGDIDEVLREIDRAVRDGARTYGALPADVRETIDSVLGGGFVTEKQKRAFMVELKRRLRSLLPPDVAEFFRDLEVE